MRGVVATKSLRPDFEPFRDVLILHVAPPGRDLRKLLRL